MKFCTVLLSWIVQLSLSRQDGPVIWIANNPPGWPSILTVENITTTGVPSSATYTWSFSGITDPMCTVYGRANTQCVGKVVDFVFPDETKYNVTVTISDNSLKSPIVLSKDIEIVRANKYPVALRPEIRQVTPQQWRTYYVAAFYRLKELGVYDHLQAVHRISFTTNSGNGRSAAHMSPTFLPWHRAFMRIFERCLQVASNRPTLGLVYMDWRKGWTGIDAYFGGNGDRSNGFIVPDGPFCNHPTAPNCTRRWPLPDDFPQTVKAIRRNIGAESYNWMTQTQFNNLVSLRDYDIAPFGGMNCGRSFRCNLEGSSLSDEASMYGENHNGFHRWLGGSFSQVTQAFNDPIFMAHHTFVDFVWAEQQRRHPCNNTATFCYRPFEGDSGITSDIPGTIRISNDGASYLAIPGFMARDRTYPWGMRPIDSMTPFQGYRFLGPDDKMPDPVPPVTTRTTTVTPTTTPTFRPPPQSRNSSFKIAVGYMSVLFASFVLFAH